MMKPKKRKLLQFACSIIMLITAIITLIDGIMGATALCILLGTALVSSFIGHMEEPAVQKKNLSFPQIAWIIASIVLLRARQGATGSDVMLSRIALCIAIPLIIPNLIYLLRNQVRVRWLHIMSGFLMVLILFAFSLGWVTQANILLDTSEPKLRQVVVVDRRIRTSRTGAQYYITIACENDDGTMLTEEFPVSFKEYEAANDGDPAQMTTIKGFWNIEYHKLAFILSE